MPSLSLPAATEATTPAYITFSNISRMIPLTYEFGYVQPKEMLRMSAPFSTANSIPDTKASNVPRPSSSKTLTHINVASGAIPVCVPEVPSPQIVPAQCVPCPL